jgi:hypothetical protein
LQVIDETETDLRQLIEGDLGPLAPSIDIWEAAVDWVHYKARQIPQRPRRVIQRVRQIPLCLSRNQQDCKRTAHRW